VIVGSGGGVLTHLSSATSADFIRVKVVADDDSVLRLLTGDTTKMIAAITWRPAGAARTQSDCS
jgi:hypothetical protein